MSADNLIPAADPAELGRRYVSTVDAVRELIVLMCDDLPADRNADLMRLVDGGGRIGLEVTTDRHMSATINLIGVEPEGTRYVLLTVTPPAPISARH